MDQEMVVPFLANVVIPSIITSGLVATCIMSYMENRRRKKQNKYQDAKDNLPILLEIQEDLNILQQACIFRGEFCPLIEHRCPEFSMADGDGSKMSYAQRGHQFRMIGYRIIRNCRTMIFLTPKPHLPEVLKTCKAINNFLCSKKSPSSKTNLDYMITCLTSSLRLGHEPTGIQPISHDSEITEFGQMLHKFNEDLEEEIEKELPSLWG